MAHWAATTLNPPEGALRGWRWLWAAEQSVRYLRRLYVQSVLLVCETQPAQDRITAPFIATAAPDAEAKEGNVTLQAGKGTFRLHVVLTQVRFENQTPPWRVVAKEKSVCRRQRGTSCSLHNQPLCKTGPVLLCLIMALP